MLLLIIMEIIKFSRTFVVCVILIFKLPKLQIIYIMSLKVFSEYTDAREKVAGNNCLNN